MKKNTLLLILGLIAVVLAGCKKDDDDDKKLVGSFMFKGEKFEIYSENGETTGTLQVFHDLGEGTSSGAFTIAGANSSKACTIQIAIEYETASGITGTYTNGDVTPSARIFDPWLSSYMTTYLSGPSMTTGNEPDGTLSIAKKSGNSYSVTFSFIYSDGSTATGNITQAYTVQEMNI